jgi:hypothetical protein
MSFSDLSEGPTKPETTTHDGEEESKQSTEEKIPVIDRSLPSL